MTARVEAKEDGGEQSEDGSSSTDESRTATGDSKKTAEALLAALLSICVVVRILYLRRTGVV